MIDAINFSIFLVTQFPLKLITRNQMEMETTFQLEAFQFMKSVLLASIYLCPFSFKEASSQSANYESTSL